MSYYLDQDEHVYDIHSEKALTGLEKKTAFGMLSCTVDKDASGQYQVGVIVKEITGQSQGNAIEKSDCTVVPAALTVAASSSLAVAEGVSFSIPAGTAGKAIDPLDLSTGVTGGTQPITFAKTSGPEWLTVSDDGKVSGTRPSAAAEADTLRVTVTDAALTSVELSVEVGEVSAASATITGIAIYEGDSPAVGWKTDLPTKASGRTAEIPNLRAIASYSDGSTQDVTATAGWGILHDYGMVGVYIRKENGSLTAFANREAGAYGKTTGYRIQANLRTEEKHYFSEEVYWEITKEEAKWDITIDGPDTVMIPKPNKANTVVSYTFSAEEQYGVAGEVSASCTMADGSALPSAINFSASAYDRDTHSVTGTLTIRDTAEENAKIKLTGMINGEEISKEITLTKPESNPLLGSVSIYGNAIVGERLIAFTYLDYNGEDAGKLFFQWMADGEAIEGANVGGYTLTAAEFGKQITVEVRNSNNSGSVLSPATDKVAKKAYAGDAPVSPTVKQPSAYDRVEITEVRADHEYLLAESSDGSAFSDSDKWVDGNGFDGVFTQYVDSSGNLAAILPNHTYHIYSRVKATADTAASTVCDPHSTAKTALAPAGTPITPVICESETTCGKIVIEAVRGQSYVCVPAGSEHENHPEWYQTFGEESKHTFEKDALGENILPDTRYLICTYLPNDGTHEASGYVHTEFTTPKPSLADAVVSDIADTTYTGDAQEPEPAVTLNGVSLKKDADYTLRYENNTEAGTATVILTGTGSYIGSTSKTWTIEKASLADAVIDAIGDVTYTPNQKQEPEPTVRLSGKPLTKGKDYTLTYQNNTNAGLATVTAVGTGSCKDTISQDFTIKQAQHGNVDLTDEAKYGERSVIEIAGLGDAANGDTIAAIIDTTNSTIYQNTPRICADGKSFEFVIRDDESLIGQISRIKLRISGTNYADYTYDILLQVIDNGKLAQEELRFTNDDSVPYGKTLPVTLAGGSGEGKVTYRVQNLGGEAVLEEDADGNLILRPLRSGAVLLSAVKAGDAQYKSASAIIAITIIRATPVGSPNYDRITKSGQTLADANLNVDNGAFDVPGTISWIDAEGNVLLDNTKVTANTYYKWRFIPTDFDNYRWVDGSVKLWSRSSGSRGHGPSSDTKHPITVTVTGGGSSTPTGLTSVTEGRSKTYTFTPSAGCVIRDVLVDGKSIGAVSSYTFQNVNEPHTLEVLFSAPHNPQTGAAL